MNNSPEEMLVNKILSIPNDRFKYFDSYYNVGWSCKFGPWYKRTYFVATKIHLNFIDVWTFEIDGVKIRSEKLVEKFDQIYKERVSNQEKLLEERRIQSLKQSLDIINKYDHHDAIQQN